LNDLFLEVGDALQKASQHHDALRFYETLIKIREELDQSLFFNLAICYQALGRPEDVRKALMSLRQGPATPEAQVALAKFHQSRGRIDLMWFVIGQLRKAGNLELVRREGLPTIRPTELPPYKNIGRIVTVRRFGHGKRGSYRRRPELLTAKTTWPQDPIHDSVIRAMYDDMLTLEDKIQHGETAAQDEWLNLAKPIFEQFRYEKSFYPYERFNKWVGFGGQPKVATLGEKEVEVDAETTFPDFVIPTSFRGIEFEDWVDFICKYAWRLIATDSIDESKLVLHIAESSNIICAEPPRLARFRGTQIRCALALNDDKWLKRVTRAAMNGSPFSAASYLLAICTAGTARHSTIVSSANEQKYVLRSVKAMDWTVLTPDQRAGFYSDYKPPGKDIKNLSKGYDSKELSVHLLAYYAYMMIVGESPQTAINYFVRALAIRPNSPTLHLGMGLAYLAMALRRQAANRNFFIQQGFSLLNEYAEMQAKHKSAAKRQEALYNVALCNYALSIYDVAIEGLTKVLALSEEVRKEGGDDVAVEAAFVLRQICVVHGDMIEAERLTDQFLVM